MARSERALLTWLGAPHGLAVAVPRRVPAGGGAVTVSDDVRDGERDARLVQATLAGRREAFGELVRHYQKRVFALAHRYVGNDTDASDLTQRAFLATFEQLDRLRRPESFAAWLFRTTANLAKNEIRFQAAKRFEDIDETPLATAPRAERGLVAQAEREAMRRALSELPDKQRRCVLLRIDGELSFREIGEAVGCTEGSARVNFHHGLKALRQRLNPAAPSPSPAPVERHR